MEKYQSKLALYIIKLFDSETQFKIMNRLNNWQVHWSLIIPFFNYYFISTKSKMALTKPLFEWERKTKGLKEILRYHNVRNPNKGDMTDEQFEDWWMLCHLTDNVDIYYKKYPLNYEKI
jgi:hypothetical protein